MLKAIESMPSLLVLEDFNAPALHNHAVARCAGVWDKAYRTAMSKSKSEYQAEKAAATAFRQAMPSLCGYENICDFIACAGYGMLIGAIKEETGSRFLYAAQIALSAFAKSKPENGRVL